MIKQEGLYQNKVNSSLASIHNCKMAYWPLNFIDSSVADGITVATMMIIQFRYNLTLKYYSQPVQDLPSPS